jgi:hypothetical protein
MHRSCEGFDESGGKVAHIVGDNMQAVCPHGEQVGHTALSKSTAEELEVLANVLPIRVAHLAVPAGQSRFGCDSRTDGNAGDVATHRFDNSYDLVAWVEGKPNCGVVSAHGVRV